MKTKLLLLLFFTILIASAQSPIPSFYGADNSSFALLSSLTPLDHSPTGANQTWNFNQLLNIGTSVKNYVNPTANQLTTYPGTTSVIVSNNNEGTTASTGNLYTKNIGNVVSITGLDSYGLQANFSTNNATIGTFPMNYGYINTDSNVSGTYVYTTYSGTFTGTMTTSVDAYGILSLNDTGFGAYSGNVTRVKTVLNISLNYTIFTNIGTATQTTYSYYDSNDLTNNPIFRSINTTAVVSLLGINENNTTLERFNTVLLGVADSAFSSLWIQNPVNNAIEIHAPNIIENATITLSDMLGKTILQTNNETINGTFDIPVSLTKGMYLITIKNKSGSVTKKFVKS